MDAAVAGIRRGRKFEQVVAGAREVFMRDGFERASVDEIARTAGVSKATLYSYFADKKVLFLEVARAECQLQADCTLDMDGEDRPAREMLEHVARSLMAFLMSPFGQRVFRLCVAESEHFPELGREFYTSGPLLAQERLKAYFQRAEARGELAIDDLDLAADQFVELCKADLFPRIIFNLTDGPAEADIARVATGAADMFLARYGRESGARYGR